MTDCTVTTSILLVAFALAAGFVGFVAGAHIEHFACTETLITGVPE